MDTVKFRVMVAVCLFLNLLGPVVAAALWDKRPKYRFAPIVASTSSGIVYAALNPAISGAAEVIKVVVSSLIIGVIFFVSVWVQCKD